MQYLILRNLMEYAKQYTNIPKEPDYEKINQFLMSVNERIILE